MRVQKSAVQKQIETIKKAVSLGISLDGSYARYVLSSVDTLRKLVEDEMQAPILKLDPQQDGNAKGSPVDKRKNAS